MDNIEIIDDFLSVKEHHYLHGVMLESGFSHHGPDRGLQWMYFPNSVKPEDGSDTGMYDYGLFYNFYKCPMLQLAGKNQSDRFDLIRPIVNKFPLVGISRIKANLEIYTGDKPFKGEFHHDMGYFDKDNNPLILNDLQTAIYYVNTCNGYTEFEDGTKVESVANRLALFSGKLSHRGVRQTDTKSRCVINFNWFRADLGDAV